MHGLRRCSFVKVGILPNLIEFGKLVKCVEVLFVKLAICLSSVFQLCRYLEKTDDFQHCIEIYIIGMIGYIRSVSGIGEILNNADLHGKRSSFDGHATY